MSTKDNETLVPLLRAYGFLGPVDLEQYKITRPKIKIYIISSGLLYVILFLFCHRPKNVVLGSVLSAVLETSAKAHALRFLYTVP